MTATRDRIIEATSALFMQKGYAGSGLKQISEASAATTGSLYHCFPGGKAELAAATLRHAGRAYQQLVEAVLDGQTDLVAAVETTFDAAAETLRASDYADACPIATVALEVASSDEALRLVTAEIFDSWLDALASRLIAGGLGAGPARELATVFLAALEGGFLLSRVAKDTTAMHHLGRAVAALVEQALASNPSS